MKNIITILAVILFMPIICIAQSKDQNYIMTTTMHDKDTTKNMKAVEYFNGLGYPTVSAAITGGSRQTTYTLTTYDAVDRKECTYLPVFSDYSLNYKSPEEIIKISKNISYKDEANTAYSRYHYDGLNRVISVELPGKAWRDEDRRNTTEYSSNVTKDYVKCYEAHVKADTLVNPQYARFRYYPEGTLTKEVNKDADKKTIETYKDLKGNIILQRTINGSSKLDTYYVYDELGNLRFVLPPKNLTTTRYEYRYDAKGRITYKKLPGCGPIRYWYDIADRVVCMNDSVMRKAGKFRFTIYDSMGRMVIQGLCSSYNHNAYSKDHSIIATFDKAKEGFLGTSYIVPTEFTNSLGNPVLEIVNYYDGNQDAIWGNIKNKFSGIKLSATVSQKGYLTGNVTMASNGDYLANVMIYDLKGNITKSKSRELDGKIITNTCKYSFTNKLLSSHIIADVKYGDALYLDQYYGYSPDIDKKWSYTLSLVHGPKAETTFSYNYDEFGRSSRISRNNLPSGKDRYVYYNYDMHGWLKQIKADSFSEELFYADGPGTKLYNGNISSIRWKDNTSSTKRGYRFVYDGANRMLAGAYGEGDNLTSNINNYSEELKYDENGNVIKVTRNGQISSGYGVIDKLNISYSGNQPSSVSESIADNNLTGSFEYKKVNGTGYKFNANGSLIADKSRGIAYITYDLNNNPDSIFFTNGSVTKYVYSASGQKLRVVHHTAKLNMGKAWGVKPKFSMIQIQQSDSTDYLLDGSLVMKNGKIDKYLFEGGYAQATPVRDGSAAKAISLWLEDDDNSTSSGSGNSNNAQESMHTKDAFDFFYYNQDHLGNNREVVNASGTVTQVTNYYPFGAPYADASASKGADVQPYKYNGKELDLMHGLNTYDYGARQHDPILARWDRIDPLCEKYYSTSPYAYCNNNSVNAIDPDGNFTVFINGFRPWAWDIAYKNALSEYWNSHDKEFDGYFGQEHNRAEYRDGSLGGILSMGPNFVLGGYSSFSSKTRYKYGYEQGRADVIGLLQKLKRNSDGTIIEPLILATHSMGGQYGKGYAQAIMDYYNKHKEMFQGFNMYEFDFAPYQADKQKAVKGVTTVQIHDKCDLVATPTLIEGADGYFVDSHLTPCMVPHFIDNTLFWNQVRNLTEGSYRVINGQIIKQ